MARKKKQSITEALYVQFTPIEGDMQALAYFEKKLMDKLHVKDCLEVSDASIIRYCLHVAYDIEKERDRKNGGKTADTY